MKGRVLELLTSHGTLIQPDAADYILGKEDPLAEVGAVLSTLKEFPLILTMEHVLRAEEKHGPGGVMSSKVEKKAKPSPPLEDKVVPVPAKAVPEPPAPLQPALLETSASMPGPRKERVHANGVVPKPGTGSLEIIKDVTGCSTCEGSISDFTAYFNDRYNALSKMLRNRREMVGTIPLNRVRKSDSEMKLVGMVKEVRSTKNGHKMLELEDATGISLILIPKNSELIREEIVPDEVIGAVVKCAKNSDLLIADELVRPETPLHRNSNRAKDPVCAAFISDIHIGSDTFLAPQWKRFTGWLRGNGTRDPLAERVRYLVITGDAVDGIGIYPGQEQELVIRDIYKQYEALADIFKEVPDDVEIIMLPGNHDAVRPAEPQPAFPDVIQKLFDSSVRFLGNPSTFRLEGVEVLAYHGRSMDDFVTGMQSMSYETPISMMKAMLLRRHLAPIYGERTPLAPEARDWMVIDTVPDIFVTGHVHGLGVERWRNIILINSSAWQGQTSFQKKHNFVPDPAKVPVVDLQSGRWKVMDFM